MNSWSKIINVTDKQNPKRVFLNFLRLIIYVVVISNCYIASAYNPSDTIHVRIPLIYSNSPVMEGDSLVVVVISPFFTQANWSGPNGFSSDQKVTIINHVDSMAQGTYYCVIQDTTYDTTFYLSTDVQIIPKAGKFGITTFDTHICENASITLTATPGFSPYKWLKDGVLYQNTTVNYITISSVPQSCVFSVIADPNGTHYATISITTFDCCAGPGEDVTLLLNQSNTSITTIQPLNHKVAIMGYYWYDNNNYPFSTVDEIVMKPNSSMFGFSPVVSPDQISLHDIYFHGCDGLWATIAFFNEFNGNTPLNVDIENCTFQDSRDGIMLNSFSSVSGSPNFPNTTFSASFALINNVFIDNYLALDVSGITFGYDNFKFLHNTITSSGAQLMAPMQALKSFEGMWLTYDQLYLHDDINNINYFSNLSRGIFAQGCEVTMEPNTCQFDNILPQLSPQGVDGIAMEFAPIPPGIYYVPGFWYLFKHGVVGNPGLHDFNNCYCAIKLGMDNSGYINYNVMTEVNNGILLENCQDRDAIFYHNEITCDYSAQNPQSGSPKGILFNQCDPMNQIAITENAISVLPSGFMSGCLFHSGANLATTAGETILDNDFNLLNGTSSTFKFGFYGLGCTGTIIGNTNYKNRIHIYDNQMAGFGVYVGNCDQVSVENNLITGPGYNVGIPGSFVPKGIYAATTTNSVYSCNELDDLVNGLTFDGVCTGTTDNIKGNTINNYYLGLYYNATALTGTQDWRGNQWTGINGYFGAQNDHQPLSLSHYWVLPYAPYLPTLNPGSIGWFGSALHPNFTCPTPGPSPQSGESNNILISNPASLFDHTDSIIALSSLSFPNYNQELTWAARRNLISKIESNLSAIASNSLMSNFYSSNINSSAWKFQSVLKARKQAMQCDPSLSNEISTFRSITFSLIDSLRIIDSLLKTGISATDSIQLMQQKFSIFSNYNGEGHVLRSSLKLAESVKNLKVDSVISMNNLLPANQLYEQNEKTVTDIYLKTYAHGNGELTTSEKDIIYNIAIQCPYSGGPAVYFARSLYLGYGGVFANDDLLCNLNQSQPQIENALIESMPCTNFKFYPNPARDQITLTWDNDSKEKCLVQFRNSLGVMIGAREFNLSNGFETIDLSSLQPGVYFISVNYFGSKTNLGKLVVIK